MVLLPTPPTLSPDCEEADERRRRSANTGAVRECECAGATAEATAVPEREELRAWGGTGVVDRLEARELDWPENASERSSSTGEWFEEEECVALAFRSCWRR